MTQADGAAAPGRATSLKRRLVTIWAVRSSDAPSGRARTKNPKDKLICMYSPVEDEAQALGHPEFAAAWQRHSVADPADACRVLDELFEWYATLGRSRRWDVAVFWRMNPDSSSDFFFSPRLCELSAAMPCGYFATRCARPSFEDGVALLVGDVRAVQLIEREPISEGVNAAGAVQLRQNISAQSRVVSSSELP